MRTQTVKGTNGKVISFLIPETPEDHVQLRKMIEDGKASANASFGDWKWSKDKGSRGRNPRRGQQG
jgi:hypothetical protein